MIEEKIAALILKLFERTLAGSIHWDSARLKKNAYQFSVPNNTIEIAEKQDPFGISSSDYYQLSIFDTNGQEIETMDESEFMRQVPNSGTTMRDLFVAARRSSHNVDKQLDEIMSALQ